MSKTTVRDKEGHYILIKGSIHQENVTNVNIYATRIRVQIYEANIERIEGRKKDSSAIIVGDSIPYFK